MELITSKIISKIRSHHVVYSMISVNIVGT